MMEKVILADAPLVQEEADFEAMVCAHARFVFRVGYAVLRNVEDAEDVVQETFLRAYRSGEAGKVERVRPWLARISWRLAIDRLRQRRKKNIHLSSDALHLSAPNPGAEAVLIRAERMALFGRLLQTLPCDLRETLELSTVEQMTSAEIAEVLGIPDSSVRNRLARARRLLKNKLSALMEGGHGS